MVSGGGCSGERPPPEWPRRDAPLRVPGQKPVPPRHTIACPPAHRRITLQPAPNRTALACAPFLLCALLPSHPRAAITARPAGPAVLRSSMTAITASLGFVHATGIDATRQGGKTARARITSDCEMTPTSITGWFRLQGTRFGGPQ